jgi:hypothetical protein
MSASVHQLQRGFLALLLLRHDMAHFRWIAKSPFNRPGLIPHRFALTVGH